MSTSVLTTSKLSRIAAVLLVGRLVYVWSGASMNHSASTPLSTSAAPVDTSPVIKPSPLMEAIALGDKGKMSESESALKALLGGKDKAAACNALGVLYYRQNKPADALAQFDAAIKADPKLADAYFNRATVRAAKGDKAGALADYSKVVELKPAAPGQTALAAAEVKRLKPAPGGKK